MQKDTVLNRVITLIRKRSKFGKKKYKATMDRRDLKPSEWIDHHQQELCDAIQYAERMKATAHLVEAAEQMISRLADTKRSLAYPELASIQNQAGAWMKSYNTQYINNQGTTDE